MTDVRLFAPVHVSVRNCSEQEQNKGTWSLKPVLSFRMAEFKVMAHLTHNSIYLP